MIDIQAGTPYVFSLLNGAELIGKVDVNNSTTDSWQLTNSFQFTMQPKIEDGKQVGASIGLTFSCHLGNVDDKNKGQDVLVPASAVAMIYPPSDQLTQMYSQQTESLVLLKR